MQRLGVVLAMVAALAVASLGFAGQASAAAKEAKVTATSIDADISKAQTKASKTCKKANRASKKAKKQNKKAKKKAKKAKKVGKKKGKSSKAAKKARKAAKKARKAAKKANKNKKRLKSNCSKDRSAVSKLKTLKEDTYFDVCVQGDCYRKIQEAADAAATFQEEKNYLATVRIQPGTYVEGVFLDGRNPAYDYNGLTIMGVKADKTPNPDARQAILEGKDATTVVDGQPQVAQNAIEARNTAGLVLKNMWARNYQNNTFFVWAATDPKPPLPPLDEYCADYVMDNLVSSDTRSYGLFARNCYGGKMINSDGWNHGDSAYYIGETPCDDEAWTNKGPNPVACQADPKWTLIDNVKSHQGSLGYSGTNSKYVKISNSDFYNNGAGLVPNTLDSEKFEPSGTLIFENNNIFWNNYNYYSSGSEIKTAIGNANPTGIGIMLYGTDGVIVRNNNIFGNEQWGAATFSGPELFGVNTGDDAKNMNNEFINNTMGRNGVDPNGNYDFFSDYSGGGNCWSGNTTSTFAPGNGSVPTSTIYPACPQTKVINNDVPSVNLGAGLQANIAYLDPQEPWRDLTTIFGLATLEPPKSSQCDEVGYYNPLCDLVDRPAISKLQECSWNISTPHPAFSNSAGFAFTEKRTDAVPGSECTALAGL